MIPAEKYIRNTEEGSALLAVLVITLLITLLLGSVWAIYLINVKLVVRNTHNLQAHYLAEAGLYKALAHYDADALLGMKNKAIPLFESDSAFVSTAVHGVYLKLQSRAKVKDQQQRVTVLVGQEADGSFEQAVLLGDVRSSLSVTGSAKIKGDMTVGPQGVELRPFKGKRFSGTVEGDVLNKKKDILPSFREDLILRSIEGFEDKLKNGTEGSSFFKGNHSQSRIFIRGDCALSSESLNEWDLGSENILICSGRMSVNGNVALPDLSVLIAGKGIEIREQVEGRQLLFYTPGSIWIEGNGNLSGQLLAGDTVTITGNARLRYPSFVWVNHPATDGQKVIEINGSAKVDGTVVYNGELSGKGDKLLNKILIGPNAIVRGSIFNTHQSELHGTLKGTLLTNQLYFYQSPTTYINWIKDGTVNVKQRPANYLLPPGFSEADGYRVIYHKN